jgi:hypothetical protein
MPHRPTPTPLSASYLCEETAFILETSMASVPTFYEMRSTRGRRRRQRGNVMVIVLLALTGLAALGGITALAATGSSRAAGAGRFKQIALYAAESGAASGIDYLRRMSAQGVAWNAFVSSNNFAPVSPADIVGNGIQPGDAGNPFSEDSQAWYEVVILNNESDPGLATAEDRDNRLILRATGHGPDGALAQIEWEVRSNFSPGAGAHCPAYGQRGLAEDGAGRNDCLLTIDFTQTATFTPGGP